MHDPVADGERPQLEFIPQPCARQQQRRWNVLNTLNRIGPFCQGVAPWSAGAQSGTASNAVHLTFDLSSQPAVAIHGKNLELHA
jgi:hypothetical protein